MRNSRITSRLCGLLACLLLVGVPLAAYDHGWRPGGLIDEPYLYPIQPGTDEWRAFTTAQQMEDACQVPEGILVNMTTPALLETAARYPLFLGLSSYNRPWDGAAALYRRSNAWQELVKRSDLQQALDDYSGFMDCPGDECDTLRSVIKLLRPDIILPEGTRVWLRNAWDEEIMRDENRLYFPPVDNVVIHADNSADEFAASTWESFEASDLIWFFYGALIEPVENPKYLGNTVTMRFSNIAGTEVAFTLTSEGYLYNSGRGKALEGVPEPGRFYRLTEDPDGFSYYYVRQLFENH